MWNPGELIRGLFSRSATVIMLAVIGQVCAFQNVGLTQCQANKASGPGTMIAATEQSIAESDDSTSNSDEIPVPATPCTRICRYNKNFMEGNVCIGCFRETFEIGSWQSMDAIDKYYTLLDAIDRLQLAEENEFISVDASGTSLVELEQQAQFWKRQSTR